MVNGEQSMRRRRYASLSIDYLTTNLAYSAVLSMLPIMLTQRVGSASVLSGVMLGVLSAAARGSTLFLGRLIEKISTLWLMQISLAIIVLGLVSFAWLLQVSPVFALLGLMLFGVGISLVNFTLRGHIIATTADSKEQASFFSLATLSANLGAAIGPITASYVQRRLGFANFLIIICLIYAVISVITGICFERHVYLRTSDSPSEENSILSTIGTLLSSRRMLPVLLIVVTGSVMNGQLFSGMSLVFHGFSSDLLPSGLFFTVDAIAGIVLQFPISRLVVRIMDTGKTSTYCMGLSLGLYGIAFALFAAGTLTQSVWFIFAALLVFASAECTYAPLTNVAMVESGENMPLVDILNCRLILTAIGESIGSFCGGFFVPLLTSAFHATWMYWLALSIIAVCGLFVSVSERKCR